MGDMSAGEIAAGGGSVRFWLDGGEVFAGAGENILEAARRYGLEIPHLCYKPGYRAAGNCRVCVVEIEGERVLAPSCCRFPREGMKVHSANARARHSQKMVAELLLADLPGGDGGVSKVAPPQPPPSKMEGGYEVSPSEMERGTSGNGYNGNGYRPRRRDDEFEKWRRFLGVDVSRFPSREQPAADLSHPAMAVNLESCIQCTRCVRACREEQVNGVIGYAGRGANAAIVFDFARAMGDSTCVGCGECVQACPTGALAPAFGVATETPDASVESLCPYCGVGCQTVFHIKDNRVLYADGREGPANRSRLCVKGRFGGDYARHRHRLLKPLMRLPGAEKNPEQMLDPDDWREVFREAEWDEALDFAGGALRNIRDEHGADALAGFGSAKGSNEEAYLFQKLVRAGFGGNNVDHCTRLCHASSVAALLEGIGSGAVSNQVSDVLKTEVAIVVGANPTVNHPVAATVMKNAAARGVRLITLDPRGSALSQHAAMDLRIKPDSDVAFLNAMMHVIVAEGMADDDFIKARTKDSEKLKAQVAKCPPELMSPICGVSPEDIRAAARLYGNAKRAMIFWGMGISQHTHGTDNARCLIALAMLTGNIGRDGCGLHPLRGQNNVQGASDAGLIPMVFPDYMRVDDAKARARFEELWGCELDKKPGLTVVEIVNAAARGDIRGMYVMGENPAMSDPDASHARAGLANLEMLAVQDIFLTETAALADVVFPASAFAEKTGTFTNTDRMVQLGRRALDLPGDARQDLWIIREMARRLGLEWDYPGAESGVARVFDEMRKAMPSIGGVTWERLQNEHCVVYPCMREGDPGETVIFKESFPTADGLGKFVPADFSPAQELPDEEYPFVLITGRELEHWHTGAMTRRSEVLDAIEPAPSVAMHPEDLEARGFCAGDVVTVSSRRGEVSLAARADANTPRGAAFIPFCYYEAAANLLTNPALDPFGKIPEFKYCAVKITPGGNPPPPLSFGGVAEAGAESADAPHSAGDGV